MNEQAPIVQDALKLRVEWRRRCHATRKSTRLGAPRFFHKVQALLDQMTEENKTEYYKAVEALVKMGVA